MFLLFLFEPFLVPEFKRIYIPICFYYFCSRMNFGYSLLISFTFQYVSIISGRIYKRVYELCKIYIPICFYYFSLNCSSTACRIPFTFQYVSIISNFFLCSFIVNFVIYIPICFYYFLPSMSRRQMFYRHLHSNMFLLFLLFLV